MADAAFHPDRNLPGCMMPDGGDCCVGYQALLADWHSLRDGAALKARITELEGALKPFARTGWMTGDTEHTNRTVIAHMHPNREYEIVLTSDDFMRAHSALNPKAGS